MKRRIAVLVVLVITVLGTTSVAFPTRAQASVWEDDNIDPMIEYMAANYAGFDRNAGRFVWNFGAVDTAMANKFIDTVKRVEQIRTDYEDADFGTLKYVLLEKILQGFELKDAAGNPVSIDDERDLVEFIIQGFFGAGNQDGRLAFCIRDAIQVLADQKVILEEQIEGLTEQLTKYLREMGQSWLELIGQNPDCWPSLQFNTKLADSAEYPLLKDLGKLLSIAFELKDIVDLFTKNAIMMVEIDGLKGGPQDYLEAALDYETFVQVKRAALEITNDILAWAAKAGATKAGAALVAGASIGLAGPFCVLVGAGVGVLIGEVTEAVVRNALEWTEKDALNLDGDLWQKLESVGIDFSRLTYCVEVQGIADERIDHYIDWKQGGEVVCIQLKNTGIKTLNVRAEPASYPLGWTIDAPGLPQNYVQVDGLEPGETTLWDLWFDVESGYTTYDPVWPFGEERHQGENPVILEFSLLHDMRASWLDLFDLGNVSLGRATQLFRNEPERELSNVDVTLIIDNSGSMASNDRSNLRRQAASVFVDAVQDDDQVGIVAFTSSASTLWPIQLVGSSRTPIKNSLSGLGAVDGTSLSAGLQSGYQQLVSVETSGNDKAAVFLTDGVGSYNNEAQMFADKGWPIYVLGLGSSIDEQLLQEIADDSGGQYQHLDDSTQLQSVYNEIATVISHGNMVLNEWTNLDMGATVQFQTALTTDAAAATFFAGWGGSTVDLSLVAPDGTSIGPETSDPKVYHSKSSTYEMYRIGDPMSGTWTLVLYGSDLPVGGEEVVVQVSTIPYLNGPPVADAGPDQVAEQTGAAGAEVTLDGSGSSDPDGDTLTYTWTWAGGSASGETAVAVFPAGTTEVTLDVSDGALSDTDVVSITVQDTIVPSVAMVTPPSGSALQDGVAFEAAATDNGSGVSSVTFSIRQDDGGDGIPVGFEDLAATYDSGTGHWTLLFDSLQVPDGYYGVLVKATDNAGNIGWVTVPYSIRNTTVLTINVVGQGSVTRNPDQSTYAPGTEVTLTAQAAYGWTFVGWSGDLTGNTNPVVVTMDTSKTITANFAIKTKVIVFSWANPTAYGQRATFAAIVLPRTKGWGVATGTVTFKDGEVRLGTAAVNCWGVAVFSTSSLPVGRHSITAVYGGDANFSSGTSSAMNQWVVRARTTIKVVSSANPSIHGRMVTFTATVTAARPGSGVPTGMVIFRDGGKTIGIGTIDATGRATCCAKLFGVGAHSITAIYVGDQNFCYSYSPVLIQKVRGW